MSGGSDEADPRTEAALIARYQRVLQAATVAGTTTEHEVNALFAEHWPFLYSVCRKFVGDSELALDLAQDTVLAALGSLHSFNGQSKFRTWLYGVARNVCLMHLRKRKELLVEDGVVDLGSAEAASLEQLQQKEREALITEAMAAVLTPQEQEVVHLRYVEGLPQSRISEMLQLEEESGARGVLQRCRRKLRRELLTRLAALGHGSSFVKDPT